MTNWMKTASALALMLSGGAAMADEVRVTWPTGVEQTLRDLAVDVVHEVVEPPTVTLSDPDRHLPADGQAEVVVEVVPRDGEGAADAAAAVSVDLFRGTGTWAGPATRDGATWRRVLIAPQAQGSAVIEVAVNGTPLAIRPRVWWDAPLP